MSQRTNRRRGPGRRQDSGPRWESRTPGGGCNSTHVARSRKKWKRRAAKAFRRTGGESYGGYRGHRRPNPEDTASTEAVVEDTPIVTVYAITHGTLDFGDLYVVREHFVFRGRVMVAEAPMLVVPTLVEARARLLASHPGLMCVGRSEEDDPVIVESWM
jgi:hypothetical protein